MPRSFTHRVNMLTLVSRLAWLGHAQAQEAMHLQLNHGRRWNIDAPLHEGMERIRATVVTTIQKHESLTTSQAQTLTVSVEDVIAFMVQHCRLEPKADSNLHILLGRLSAATAAVEANHPKAANGLPQMLEVLDIYPRFSPIWNGKPSPTGIEHTINPKISIMHINVGQTDRILSKYLSQSSAHSWRAPACRSGPMTPARTRSHPRSPTTRSCRWSRKCAS